MRFGTIRRGPYKGSVVRECEDGRYTGADDGTVTLVTIQHGQATGQILAVRECEVRWAE